MPTHERRIHKRGAERREWRSHAESRGALDAVAALADDAPPWSEVTPHVLRAQRGDKAARDVVLRSSALAIIDVAHRAARTAYDPSEGMHRADAWITDMIVAMDHAIRSYDPVLSNWGTHLYTYLRGAVPRVWQGLGTIRIPSHAWTREGAGRLRPVSLLEDDVAMHRARSDSVIDDVQRRAAPKMSAELLDEALARRDITKREHRVLRLRYGLETGRPVDLVELARVLHVGRIEARRIEAEALRKMQGATARRRSV